MLNFLLTTLAFILSTATFSLSFSYSGVARTFTSFGKAIAEISVVIPETVNGVQSKPYFDREQFEKLTKKHFDEGLKRYLRTDDEYSLKYFYFDAFSEIKLGTLHKPTGITVTFKCPVSWFGTYENETTLTIKEGYVNE